MTFAGLGYRAPLAKWIGSGRAEIECLGLTAEHFFDQSDETLAEVRRTGTNSAAHV